MTHEVKVWPEYFDAIKRGDKTFEIRRNDRDYQVGDTLILKEFDPIKRQYTGNSIKAQITYLTNFMQVETYVVMSIKLV